jgi:adenylate cyclase
VEFTVRFLPSGRVARVPAGTTLLQAARQAELPVASGCGENHLCALCGLEIVEGSETLPPESDEELKIKQLNRVDAKLRLSCHLEVVGDLVVSAQYW